VTTAAEVRSESTAQLNSLVMAVSHGQDALPLAAFLRNGKRQLVLGVCRQDEWGQGWEWLADYTRRVGADAVVVSFDSFTRTVAADEPFPYAEGGAPRDDPKATEAVLSWGLAHRQGNVHVDCAVFYPYSRADDGAIVWGSMASDPSSVIGEVPNEIARGLTAPRGDDLAGAALDARKAGHLVVMLGGRPYRGPR